MKTMMEDFRSPGAEYRGAPFWAWNAKLDPEELVRQIRIFKQMGLGGFFMHSRVGLDTEYLGREWFDCVKTCVAEAKKLGMQADLYDEDRWPSGAAGSLVTRDDRYKFRFCAAEFFRSADAARQLPADGWHYELGEPNVLVLDHADWRIDGNAMGKDVCILKLDDELRNCLGRPPRGGKMVQPWLRGQRPPEKTVELELTYHLRIGELPAKECRLAVEHPEYYRFELNGRTLEIELDGWWCDRCLECVKLPVRLLKKGENLLILRSRYHENLPGLEAMFLLGGFGVEGDTVVRLPETLSVGDWCKQGLRHFAADVTYWRELEIPAGGAVLELGGWRGVLAGVCVDDRPETLLPWPPYKAELPAGKHRIGIRIYGSRRNAMGPFFCKETWPVRTGPGQFKQLDVKERNLVPCGMLTPPVLRKIRK